jgi:hypothetical protein
VTDELLAGGNVQAKLMATGRFSRVEIVDAVVSTPTRAKLQSYSCLLYYGRNGFFDQTAIGDSIADFVEAGGEVTFMVSSGGFGEVLPFPSGRRVTAGYFPLDPPASGQAYVSSLTGIASDRTLVLSEPGHPSCKASTRSC